MFNQKEFLGKIKEKVLQHDPQATVILFGSRARGDYKPDSDWDILMLTDKKADHIFQNKVLDAVYDLELEYLQAISLMVRNRYEWEDWSIIPLYTSIAHEGVAL